MSEIKLLPCPICGGEVAIALNGDNVEQWYSITRGFGENKCTCRLFMESEKFDAKCLLGTRERAKNKLAKAWNTRKPMERILTRLEELRTRYFLTIANTGNIENDVAYENVANVLNGVIAIVKEEGGIE